MLATAQPHREDYALEEVCVSCTHGFPWVQHGAVYEKEKAGFWVPRSPLLNSPSPRPEDGDKCLLLLLFVGFFCFLHFQSFIEYTERSFS